LTQQTRVRNALDDVASNIHECLPQSDLTLPYSMLAPKYCTDGSGAETSDSDTSHASCVAAKVTRKSFASFCCAACCPYSALIAACTCGAGGGWGGGGEAGHG